MQCRCTLGNPSQDPILYLHVYVRTAAMQPNAQRGWSQDLPTLFIACSALHSSSQALSACS
jgi:hypothetical protein